MRNGYNLVNSDGHINEPPNLWLDRLPAEYRDRAPRMEHFPQGDAWILEGAVDPINFGMNAGAGKPNEEIRAWVRWEDVPKGGYEPAPRLEEQDADGVGAEVLYPTPRISSANWWN